MAQATCRLGMAAYWLEIPTMAHDSNDQSPPGSTSVST